MALVKYTLASGAVVRVPEAVAERLSGGSKPKPAKKAPAKKAAAEPAKKAPAEKTAD